YHDEVTLKGRVVSGRSSVRVSALGSALNHLAQISKRLTLSEPKRPNLSLDLLESLFRDRLATQQDTRGGSLQDEIVELSGVVRVGRAQECLHDSFGIIAGHRRRRQSRWCRQQEYGGEYNHQIIFKRIGSRLRNTDQNLRH